MDGKTHTLTFEHYVYNGAFKFQTLTANKAYDGIENGSFPININHLLH